MNLDLLILFIFFLFFFFFNDTATTEIYTLSLHDALPISCGQHDRLLRPGEGEDRAPLVGDGHAGDPLDAVGPVGGDPGPDRKSTRLNSSHANISYAVFCLKKKKYYKCTLNYSSTNTTDSN